MALQEPVGPEIRVRLPGRQQVPGDHQDRVRDRQIAFLCPRRPLSKAAIATLASPDVVESLFGKLRSFEGGTPAGHGPDDL